MLASLSFLYRNTYTFARLFTDFHPDVFPDPYDITDGTVRVFHAHIDDTAVVGFAVKRGMDFTRPLPNSVRIS